MKIQSVETSIVRIPFTDAGRGEGLTPTPWRDLEILLVRVVDTDGNVGWGEAFGYFTVEASQALIRRMIGPATVGQDIEDIAAWNSQMQRRLALFGRYGVTLFALSGVDMALWDLAARRKKLPLHCILGQQSRENIPFYASLVRYGDGKVVAQVSRNAVADGFVELKLHEITLPEIEACRTAIGDGIPISVDVNCNWTVQFARKAIPQLVRLGVSWLEEPIFPPEDFEALAGLRQLGLPIAAGENWSSAFQFNSAIRAEAVDLLQPSVTKIGGLTEFVTVAELAKDHAAPLLPHCPYFGPGFHASLHLAAVYDGIEQLEYLFVEPDAWLAPIRPLKTGTSFSVPDGPGLGFVPNQEVLSRYADR